MKQLERLARHGVVLALCATSFGCGSDDEETPGGGELSATYSEIVYATYSDALAEARKLDTAVIALVDTPSEANIAAARIAWRAAREPYLQSEVFRFYDGPIDNPEDGPEGLINSWPLDENFIDYVAEDADAGIINDPSVTISAATLESMNQGDAEENVTTGYHAVEFLLWGQDLSATGPGNRPFTDYVAGASGTAANQARRGTYLKTVSTDLVDRLEGLVDAWAPDEDNYREEFEGLSSDEALSRVLTGMIFLSGFETGGERLQAALETGEQEDEHSCFSDNTKRDMVQDIQGVLNVWRGQYNALGGADISGTGVRDVVRAKDAALADELDDQIEESLRLANALQDPFDREIARDNPAGQARVEALVDALRDQWQLLFDVFAAFELEAPADSAIEE
jgi:putative iron-regulated protein